MALLFYVAMFVKSLLFATKKEKPIQKTSTSKINCVWKGDIFEGAEHFVGQC